MLRAVGSKSQQRPLEEPESSASSVGPAFLPRLHAQLRSAADHGANKRRFGELRCDVGQETIELGLDYLVTLTGPRLHTRAIEYGDPASPVTYQSGVLQLPGSLGDAFAAHAQHVGDQFLCHGEFVR